jgi:hypothetical protein
MAATEQQVVVVVAVVVAVMALVPLQEYLLTTR